MKKIILIVMMLCGISYGATKYVNVLSEVAKGDASGDNVANPMSLKSAMAACTTDTTYILADTTYSYDSEGGGGTLDEWIINAKTPAAKVTFQSTSGTASSCIITNAGTAVNGSVYMLNSKNIEFKNLTIKDGGTSTAAVYLRSTDSTALTGIIFTNCPIEASKASGNAIYIQTTAGTGTISATFTSCNVTVSSSAVGLIAQAATIADLTVTGGTWTCTGTGSYLFSCLQATNSCTLTGAIFSSTSANTSTGVIYCPASGASGNINISNNSITSTASAGWGIYVYDYWTNVKVANNTVYSNNNSATMSGIAVGKDAATAGSAMGQVVVYGNTYSMQGTTALASHGLLIGSGADGADVYDNTIILPTEASSTVNIGLVVKAERCSIRNNVIKGYRGLYLKGGGNNIIKNNNFISTGTYAVTWVTDTDQSKNNTIMNNIITGGTYCLFAETAGNFNNRYDYNCYVSGSTAFSAFDTTGTTKQTAFGNVANGLIAYWATLTTSLWTDNDSHSINETPVYVSSTDYRTFNANLRLTNGYIGAKKPVENRAWLK